MAEKWRIISDTGSETSREGRLIVSEKVEGGNKFTPSGQLIVAPKLPDIPPSLLKRCTKEELEKWDKERDEYNKQFTLILRSIA